jgi:hypothetical protein
MSTLDDTPKTDTNETHDGFVWSQRAKLIAAFVFALALAVAQYGSVLAAPIEWQR